MTFNILNLPSITNSNRSYILSVLYVSNGSNYYGNSVSISTNGVVSSDYITPNFSITPNTAITNGKLIIQQIIYFYLGSVPYLISNISGFAS